MLKERTPLDYATEAVEMMMRKFKAEDLPPKGDFHYHQGVFLSGVYKNYVLKGEENWFTYIKDWVDFMVTECDPQFHHSTGYLDDMQAGILLFPLYERTKELRYKRALDTLMDELRCHPTNKEGGFWHMIRLRDQMWLDGIYMVGPLSCMYGKVFECPEFFDIAAEQVILMEQKTRDHETGLWYHAYDCERTQSWADKETGCSEEFWGRSIGWVLVAVLDELDCIPKDHPQRDRLEKLVKDLLAAICNYQSTDGRWYQVVNKGEEKGNWLENSCSCLYVAAIRKAVRMKILDKEYLEYARKGYEGVINSLTWLDGDIQIGQICVETGVGDYKYYCDRPVSVNDLHGVGAFLLMCAEMQMSL